MYCTKCGNEVPKGYKFCPKCGAKLVVPMAENQAKPDPEEPKPQVREEPAPAQPQPGKKPSGHKKAAWIGIVIAVIIILVAVLAVVLVRNKQQNSAQPASVSSAQAVQASTANSAAKETSYLADISLIPDSYIEKYKNDLLGKLNGANQEIVEVGFSRANNVNKPEGKTHNSLCFLVENDDGTYDEYEYADIKIDGNNNLLPPVYKGATEHLNSWDSAQSYLRDKPNDAYHYEAISNY